MTAEGGWTDLVPVASADMVLLPASLDETSIRFEDRGARVITLDSLAAAGVGSSEIVVIDAREPDGLERVPDGLDALASHGRLVIVGVNPWSPLVLARRPFRRGRPARPRSAGRDRFARLLRSDSQVVAVHSFSLFPDLDTPTSAYRTDMPAVAELVLRAAGVGAGRTRGLLLGLLRRGSRFDVSRHAAPAWMLVASVGGPPGRLAPSGRIGVAANEQGVVLLGSGPEQIEKRYRDRATADRVAAVHGELIELGIDVVAPVRGRPSPTRLRFDWVEGSDIDTAALADEDLGIWGARAAEVLGRIHGATLHDDGTVCTHGDFWLGALIADRDAIVGVIDWTDSRRGEPAVDVELLTRELRLRSNLDDATRDLFFAEMARRYEAAGGPEDVFAGAIGRTTR